MYTTCLRSAAKGSKDKGHGQAWKGTWKKITKGKAPEPQARGTFARVEGADRTSAHMHTPREVPTPCKTAVSSIFTMLGTWALCSNVFIYSFIPWIFTERPLHAWFVLDTP